MVYQSGDFSLSSSLLSKNVFKQLSLSVGILSILINTDTSFFTASGETQKHRKHGRAAWTISDGRRSLQ